MSEYHGIPLTHAVSCCSYPGKSYKNAGFAFTCWYTSITISI